MDGALTRDTCHHVAHIIEAGHHSVMTHGNGRQIGFTLRRYELARQQPRELPLDSCGADVGIPVTRDAVGDLTVVEAVIDQDGIR